MAKKVVVVGGTGNMSTGIVRLLVEKGYDVTIYARGTSYLEPNPDARVIKGDRHDGTFIETMRKENFDFAIDMITHSLQDAKDSYEAFRDCERYVFCSTGAVATPFLSTKCPIREYDWQAVPSWAYGVAKKSCEDYFMMRYHEHGFHVTILRPATTYGRTPGLVRQTGNISGVNNVWINRIEKGKPIVVGNPHIMRSFMHADDTAAAFVGALNHSICDGQAYNLVGENCIDWGMYNRALMKAIGKEVEMVEVPIETLEAFVDENFQIGPMVYESFLYNGFFSGEKIAKDIPEFHQNIDIEKGMELAYEFYKSRNMIPDCDAYTLEDEIIAAQKATRIRR